MKVRATTRAAAALLALLASCAITLTAGCGSDKPAPPPPQRGAVPAPPPAAAQVAAQAAASAASAVDGGAPDAESLQQDLSESDFMESDRNRDPFRSFSSVFVERVKKPVVDNTRKVLAQNYTVDELKLVAIVLGDDSRAMVLDPTKKGWVLRRGDYLGRAETVHIGGAQGVDYQLNWRVDRIRDGDLVLIREDTAQKDVAPQTRVLVLRSETDKPTSGVD